MSRGAWWAWEEGSHAGVLYSLSPKSVADMGMGMSVPGSSRVCHWGGVWECRLGVGACQPTSIISLTLFSAVPSRGAPLPPQPSETVGRRAADHGPVSQIPHCLRGRGTGQGRGAMCSSPLSLSLSLEPCEPPLSFLHHCLQHQPPLTPSPAGAGRARSSIPPSLLPWRGQ